MSHHTLYRPTRQGPQVRGAHNEVLSDYGASQPSLSTTGGSLGSPGSPRMTSARACASQPPRTGRAEQPFPRACGQHRKGCSSRTALAQPLLRWTARTHLQLLNDVLVVPLVGSGGDSREGPRGHLVIGSVPLGGSHRAGTTAEQQANVGVQVHGQRDAPALGWLGRGWRGLASQRGQAQGCQTGEQGELHQGSGCRDPPPGSTWTEVPSSPFGVKRGSFCLFNFMLDPPRPLRFPTLPNSLQSSLLPETMGRHSTPGEEHHPAFSSGSCLGEKTASQLPRCQLDTKKDLLRSAWEQRMDGLRNNCLL